MGILPSLILVAIVFFAGFGSGWKASTMWDAAENAAAERARVAAVDAANKRADDVSENFAKKLAAFKVTQQTFYNETKTEVQKPVYVDPRCVIPESGVQLRNRAIDAADSDTGQPSSAVSADSKNSTGASSFFRGLLPSGSGSNQPVR